MLVFDPSAPTYSGPGAAGARRSVSLAGATIGFIDNSKPNFLLLAQEIGAALEARHGAAGTMIHSKRAPTLAVASDALADMLERCDIVVTGSGD